jgi:hypothetical protein
MSDYTVSELLESADDFIESNIDEDETYSEMYI